MINLDGRIFRSASNTPNGDVSEETTFYYHQKDRIVWAEYAGGDIVQGHLMARLLDNGELEASYHHISTSGQLRVGCCHSIPELQDNGKWRLRENWQWLNGDCSSGCSEIHEL